MRNSEIQMLFGYLYWVRDRVLAAARDLEPHGDLHRTLVHELDVESGWRARLSGAIEIDLDPADYPTLDAVAEHWRRDEGEMRRWLPTLSDAELAAAPPREQDQAFPLWYYLVHVVSHGIQELEEAVALLAPSGQSPRNLGFLDYADATADESPNNAESDPRRPPAGSADQ